MLEFCGEKGIKQEFSNARTPQQNGVAERMNRTLIEAARTMLADSHLAYLFLGRSNNTACYKPSTVLKRLKKLPCGFYLLFSRKAAGPIEHNAKKKSHSSKDHPTTPKSNLNQENMTEALEDGSWVKAMQEELLQFKLQQVWVLVDLPNGAKVIGTKWVYRNKKDERGVVVRNKARLGLKVIYKKKGLTMMRYSKDVTSHAVKRLFKYLKANPTGLWYPRDSHSPLIWKQFSDSDYGGSTLTGNTTTGG
ncbi:ribonuclease H-like domain-containing protein [Tanacetum coccineum]